MRTASGLLLGSILVSMWGCAPTFTDAAKHGIILYCPGAGNVDFGDAGIRDGMTAAGFRGQVGAVVWTVSLNPAIDQALRINARLAAGALSATIHDYLHKYPNRPINVIGLSAGTGVAVWALEDLKPDEKVDNVILLSSSLASDYDISMAERHVTGRIYVYHSPHDLILAGPMKLFGTIDGRWGIEGAGEVGLHPPKPSEKVVNIAWRPSFESLGYYGGHMDSTAPRFVQSVLSKHLTPAEKQAHSENLPAIATTPGQRPPGGGSSPSPGAGSR